MMCVTRYEDLWYFLLIVGSVGHKVLLVEEGGKNNDVRSNRRRGEAHNANTRKGGALLLYPTLEGNSLYDGYRAVCTLTPVWRRSPQIRKFTPFWLFLASRHSTLTCAFNIGTLDNYLKLEP